MRIERSLGFLWTSSSHTSPASAPAIRSTRLRTACRAQAGFRSGPAGSCSQLPAKPYVVTKGDSRQLVLYWYWAHDRGVASEYWAKFYLVADSIRMSRSDGALVRLTTPMQPGESV